MDGIKLSILLCSVPSRLGKYPIINELCRQANKRPVEVIYLGDNYNWTIGEKRNKLIQLASGKYCTFVDDDDRVTVDYIDTLLNAMNDSPEV
jgi:glycosyltransferase involved in cell wall biosynthesis